MLTSANPQSSQAVETNLQLAKSKLTGLQNQLAQQQRQLQELLANKPQIPNEAWVAQLSALQYHISTLEQIIAGQQAILVQLQRQMDAMTGVLGQLTNIGLRRIDRG